jgi:hypothetical protein
MDFARGPQRVPSIVRKLVQRILAGDTDAVELLGTPRNELLKPRAHRAAAADVSAAVEDTGDVSHSEEGKENDLVVSTEPPTAIRASFWRYSFSSWAALRDEGRWWTRERIEGAEDIVWQRDLDARPRGGIGARQSVWWRQWTLLGCVLCMHAALARRMFSGRDRASTAVRSFVIWCARVMGVAGAFTLALAMDYVEPGFVTARGSDGEL